MKYICLGHIEPGKLPKMTEEDLNRAIQLISHSTRGRYGGRSI
jgi:hypothetical protein